MGHYHSLSNFTSSHNGRQGEPVTNTLGHGNHVRDNTVAFKPPKMLAGSSETRLYFVRNAKAAVSPDLFKRFLQIAFGILNWSSDTL